MHQICDCVLTVPGNGHGGHGKPKYTRNGPLTEFLVDNTVFYIVITEHIRGCDKCSVDAVLKAYLQRRLSTSKFKGQTSVGLANRAVTLEGVARKKGETLTPGLVNEFIWRSGPGALLGKHAKRISLREKYMACKNTQIEELFHWFGREGIGLSETNRIIATLALQDLPQDIPEDELQKLMEVCEVMSA